MKLWLAFFKERLPLPVLVIMSVGFSGTSQYLSLGQIHGTNIFLGCVLALSFFVVLRVMDEIKDYSKDQVAHPTRPLPRGLLTVAQAKSFVRIGLGVLVGEAVLLFLLGFTTAALLFLVTTGYLYLMYREFFVGKWLEKQLIIYLISHQSVLIFLAASTAAIAQPLSATVLDLVKPGLFFLGTFLIYEVSRKLDPKSHPILQTYLVHYGMIKTGLLMACGSLILVYSLYLNCDILGKVIYGLAVLPLLQLILYPVLVKERHKGLEGLAGLLLLINLWVPFLVGCFA